MEEECQELSVESLKFLESIDIEQLVNYYAELKNLLHIVEPALTVSYATTSLTNRKFYPLAQVNKPMKCDHGSKQSNLILNSSNDV
jgi:hypothetical protein